MGAALVTKCWELGSSNLVVILARFPCGYLPFLFYFSPKCSKFCSSGCMPLLAYLLIDFTCLLQCVIYSYIHN